MRRSMRLHFNSHTEVNEGLQTIRPEGSSGRRQRWGEWLQCSAMVPRLFLIIYLLLLVDAQKWSIDGDCKPCECYYKMSSFGRMRTVNCSKRELSTIPQNFPPDVMALDLSWNSLTVAQLESLCQLKSLQSLSLSHNKLTSLSTILAQCSSLLELNLTGNRLNYIGEETFDRMENLKRLLGLEVRSITSREVFKGMNNLKDLDLFFHGDRLPKGLFDDMVIQSLNLVLTQSTCLPKGIFEFGQKTLNTLQLIGENITELDEDLLDGLYVLRKLYLTVPRTSQLPERFFHSQQKNQQQSLPGANSERTLPANLQEIEINGIGILPPRLFNQLVNLETLTLKKIGNFPLVGFLSEVMNLQMLVITDSKLTRIPAAWFKELYSLKYLKLSRVQLEWLHENAFEGLLNLNYLDLSNNRLQQIMGQMLVPVSQSLETLILSGNQLSEIKTGLLNGLHSLHFLDVSDNQLSNIDSNAFSGLTYLSVIYLNNNRLTGLSDDVFKDQSEVQSLSIADNYLAQFPVAVLKLNMSLINLDLSSNELMTLPAAQFCQFSYLEIVNVMDNVLHCSCSLLALRECPQIRVDGKCKSPAELSGKVITEVDVPASCTSVKQQHPTLSNSGHLSTKTNNIVFQMSSAVINTTADVRHQTRSPLINTTSDVLHQTNNPLLNMTSYTIPQMSNPLIKVTSYTKPQRSSPVINMTSVPQTSSLLINMTSYTKSQTSNPLINMTSYTMPQTSSPLISMTSMSQTSNRLINMTSYTMPLINMTSYTTPQMSSLLINMTFDVMPRISSPLINTTSHMMPLTSDVVSQMSSPQINTTSDHAGEVQQSGRPTDSEPVLKPQQYLNHSSILDTAVWLTSRNKNKYTLKIEIKQNDASTIPVKRSVSEIKENKPKTTAKPSTGLYPSLEPNEIKTPMFVSRELQNEERNPTTSIQTAMPGDDHTSNKTSNQAGTENTFNKVFRTVAEEITISASIDQSQGGTTQSGSSKPSSIQTINTTALLHGTTTLSDYTAVTVENNTETSVDLGYKKTESNYEEWPGLVTKPIYPQGTIDSTSLRTGQRIASMHTGFTEKTLNSVASVRTEQIQITSNGTQGATENKSTHKYDIHAEYKQYQITTQTTWFNTDDIKTFNKEPSASIGDTYTLSIPKDNGDDDRNKLHEDGDDIKNNNQNVKSNKEDKESSKDGDHVTENITTGSRTDVYGDGNESDPSNERNSKLSEDRGKAKSDQESLVDQDMSSSTTSDEDHAFDGKKDKGVPRDRMVFIETSDGTDFSHDKGAEPVTLEHSPYKGANINDTENYKREKIAFNFVVSGLAAISLFFLGMLVIFCLRCYQQQGNYILNHDLDAEMELMNSGDFDTRVKEKLSEEPEHEA